MISVPSNFQQFHTATVHKKIHYSPTDFNTRTNGAGYSEVCLREDFRHTKINIFSPLCFLNEIWIVVKLTNHEQRSK